MSFNGQWFEVELTDLNHGGKVNRKITDFNEFVDSWQIVSYGTPAVFVTLVEPVEFIQFHAKITFSPNCECGAHKLGVKDYAKGHSTWCKVFKDDA